jgi:hypothetical protein
MPPLDENLYRYITVIMGIIAALAAVVALIVTASS